MRRPADDDGGYTELTSATFSSVVAGSMERFDTVHIEMEVPLAEMSMSLDVRYGAGDEVGMAGTIEDVAGVGELIMLGDQVYTREAGTPTYFQLPDHIAESLTGQADLGSPTGALAAFTEALEDVEYVRATPGVAYGTAHEYALTMRADYMADELDLPVSAVEHLVFVVWLDDDHLLHRFDFGFMGHQATTRYDAWGEPVTIEAPPADEVKPLPMPCDVA